MKLKMKLVSQRLILKAPKVLQRATLKKNKKQFK
jgi:hypothetical protein